MKTAIVLSDKKLSNVRWFSSGTLRQEDPHAIL